MLGPYLNTTPPRSTVHFNGSDPTGGMGAESIDPESRPTPGERLEVLGQVILVALAGLLVGSILFSVVAQIGVVFGVVELTANGQLDVPVTARFVVTIAFSGVGLALTTAGFLYVRSEPLSFIDVEVPSLRDVGYGVVGLVALFVLSVTVSLLFEFLGVQSAPSGIETTVRETGATEALLVLIPLSLFVIGPGEELVYRNVIQKRLYDTYPRLQAVVLASLVFAAVHILQYRNADPAQTIGALSVVFVLALVLGFVYERTENVLVPAAVHGLFNATQFLLLYVQITGGFEPAMVALV